MLTKLKNLFNVKKWLEGVLFTKVAAKAGKYAAAAVAALFAAPKVAEGLAKVKPILDDAGIDPEKAATVIVMAAISALLNWLKHGPLKAE